MKAAGLHFFFLLESLHRSGEGALHAIARSILTLRVREENFTMMDGYDPPRANREG